MTDAHATMNEEALRNDKTTLFGFWIYLMTDFVLFASLFSVFIVLRGNIFSGEQEVFFSMPAVLLETLILLLSSFACGLALVAARAQSLRTVITLLAATMLLGFAFLYIELAEFRTLILEGRGPSSSGFFSAFFTLVGTHGLHIAAGIVWMLTLMGALIRHGLVRANMRKLLLLSMFWHFLDIVWIFIFTIVYLLGTV